MDNKSETLQKIYIKVRKFEFKWFSEKTTLQKFTHKVKINYIWLYEHEKVIRS